ncbi:hypothetical protein EXIGLDRAFT_731543 [Exidia glandulosa HHB12029]|uniref:Uncharacterized protein n=1 Tax=Exidia glandulosa HHB12029 TaxID=1314781 RepID=A0A165BUA5_EXIGL|nr:hypothetical protein EXIGLDRAFT_731543 [Exidia glandulosa HHB12029]
MDIDQPASEPPREATPPRAPTPPPPPPPPPPQKKSTFAEWTRKRKERQELEVVVVEREEGEVDADGDGEGLGMGGAEVVMSPVDGMLNPNPSNSPKSSNANDTPRTPVPEEGELTMPVAVVKSEDSGWVVPESEPGELVPQKRKHAQTETHSRSPSRDSSVVTSDPRQRPNMWGPRRPTFYHASRGSITVNTNTSAVDMEAMPDTPGSAQTQTPSRNAYAPYPQHQQQQQRRASTGPNATPVMQSRRSSSTSSTLQTPYTQRPALASDPYPGASTPSPAYEPPNTMRAWEPPRTASSSRAYVASYDRHDEPVASSSRAYNSSVEPPRSDARPHTPTFKDPPRPYHAFPGVSPQYDEKDPPRQPRGVYGAPVPSYGGKVSEYNKHEYPSDFRAGPPPDAPRLNPNPPFRAGSGSYEREPSRPQPQPRNERRWDPPAPSQHQQQQPDPFEYNRNQHQNQNQRGGPWPQTQQQQHYPQSDFQQPRRFSDKHQGQQHQQQRRRESYPPPAPGQDMSPPGYVDRGWGQRAPLPPDAPRAMRGSGVYP